MLTVHANCLTYLAKNWQELKTAMTDRGWNHCYVIDGSGKHFNVTLRAGRMYKSAV